MSDSSTDDPPRESPWPFLIAVGLVGSEIGIFLGLLPVSIGGLVLLVASLTGLAADATNSDPWPIGAGLGVLFVAFGAVLYAVTTGFLAIGATAISGLADRGLSIVVAGILSLGGSAIGSYRDR